MTPTRPPEIGSMGRDAEPLFAVACPGCRATVATDRGLVGKAAQCPLCAADFLVPDPGPAPPTELVRQPSPFDRARDQIPAPTASGAAAAAPAGLVLPADDPAGRVPRDEALPRPVAADAGAALARRLTNDERSRRRSRRTLVIMIGGITILLVLAATLGRRPSRSRR